MCLWFLLVESKNLGRVGVIYFLINLYLMIKIKYFVIILVKSSLFLRILQRFAPMFHMVTGPGQAQELLVGHVNYWQKGCICM